MSDESTTTTGAETPVTPPGARDAAIAALQEMREPKAPAEAEAPKEAPAEELGDTKAEAAEEHEVKAAPEAELKMKLRARLANIEAKEREFTERVAAREREIAERAAEVDRRNSTFGENLEALRRLSQDDPSKFLEQTGIDLNSLVKAKIQEGKPEAVADRALREMLELRKQIETERAEAKRAAAEREQNAARAAQEQGFLDLAKPESTPFLARLAAKNPSLAIQNAYLLSGVMQRESGGKMPELAELAKRVDAELRAAFLDEAAEAAPAEPAKNGITPKKAATAVVVKSPEDMTAAEKRAEAMRILRELRKS